MRGIYVDRWRLGTHSEKEVDALLAFCDKANIQDIFLHNHQDRAVNDNWDYVDYILKHRGKKNIHLWVSLSLGRDNEWTREKIVEIHATEARAVTIKPSPVSMFTEKKRDEGTILSLNPKDEYARSYFVKRIITLKDRYPDLYGFHIDKLEAGADQLISEIRKNTKGKYLSIPVNRIQNFWKKWEVDEKIPMFINYSRAMFDKYEPTNKRIGLGCFGCDVSRTKENLKRCEELGVEPIFYSYGAYSWKANETREDFLNAIS